MVEEPWVLEVLSGCKSFWSMVIDSSPPAIAMS